MSDDEPSINEAIVAQLQAAARRRPKRPPADPRAAAAAEEYDWDRPHRFTAAERQRLSSLASRAADHVAAALGTMLAQDLRLAASASEERYAVPPASDAEPAYRLGLTADGRPVGTLVLPAETAVRWVDQLLGGQGDAEEAPRGLSAMEIALLLDVAAAAARGLSSALCEFGGPAIQAADEILRPGEVGRTPPVSETPGEELWQFDVAARAGPEAADDAEGEAEAPPAAPPEPGEAAMTVAFQSEALEAFVAGPVGGGMTAGTPSYREAVLAHLRAAPVEATVRLGAAEVRVRDLMLLGPGDVVVLDTGVDDPLTLSVGDVGVLRGTPATSDGRYAVRVCEFRRYPRLDVDIGATGPKKGSLP